MTNTLTYLLLFVSTPSHVALGALLHFVFRLLEEPRRVPRCAEFSPLHRRQRAAGRGRRSRGAIADSAGSREVVVRNHPGLLHRATRPAWGRSGPAQPSHLRDSGTLAVFSKTGRQIF